MKKLANSRLLIMFLILPIVGVLFASVMYSLQIVQGEKYEAMAQANSYYTIEVSAARGNITDRNGVLLASNRIGYNCQFNRLYLPTVDLSDTILTIAAIVESHGDSWIDVLPINVPTSEDTEFRFDYPPGDNTATEMSEETRDANVETLKRNNGLNVYADAENVMAKLIEKYDLQEYSRVEQRRIAGVRYSMEIKGYNNSTPYVFAEDLSNESVTAIEEQKILTPGVEISEEAIREYPNGDLIPHIVGYIGALTAEEYEELREDGYKYNDVKGKAGIELAYESVLRGTSGKRKITRNTQGNIVSTEEVEAPVAGKTVQLSIDAELQANVYDILERHINRIRTTTSEGRNADAGAIVVLDVNTGEILASVSYPGYDLNTFRDEYDTLRDDERNPLTNRVLHGLYTPGSVFKMAVGLGALEKGQAGTYYCGGTYMRWPNSYRPTCMGTHGNITLQRALQVSCNIYFYEAAWNQGIDSLYSIAGRLGFGKKTGVELNDATGSVSHPDTKAEIEGRYSDSPDPWYQGDVVQAGIGQGYTLATPLQLANYVATIAGYGTRLEPRYVMATSNNDGTNKVETKRVVAEEVGISEDYFKQTEAGMVAVSRSGTGAPGFGSYVYDIASKTGTPQAGSSKLNAIYVAYGPVPNAEIAVAAIVENGGTSYVLSPMVAEVFDAYFFPEKYRTGTADGAE